MSIEEEDIVDIQHEHDDEEIHEDEIEESIDEKGNKKKQSVIGQICLDTKPMCTIGSWTDHNTYEEKLTVLVVLPSGVTDGEVHVPASTDGTDKIFVSYSWSEKFVDMKTIFDKDITKGIMTCTHPEIIALNESFKKHRKNLDDIPTSIIEVKLPYKVQTSPKSYEHDVKVNRLDDGNHLVTLRVRLTAFSTEYIVSSEKKKMKISFT